MNVYWAKMDRPVSKTHDFTLLNCQVAEVIPPELKAQANGCIFMTLNESGIAEFKSPVPCAGCPLGYDTQLEEQR